MAKQIILLDSRPNGGAGTVLLRYLLWLTTGKAIPNPNFVSQYGAISGLELTALQAGTTIEESYSIAMPTTSQESQIKDYTSNHWVARQNYWNTTPGPAFVNGIYFDSITFWSA